MKSAAAATALYRKEETGNEKKMRVLVVDDSPVQRALLTSLLRSRGHEVDVACDGVQAWEMVLERPPSIIFADWMMPKMNGLELVRKIRARDFGQYVYVILCTGRGSHADLIEGMRSGSDDFLAKPIKADELSVRVSAGERVIQLENRLREEKWRLEEANKSLSLAYETMRADLESAAEMQRTLLPPPARIHDMQFEWLFCPAKVVAGDILSFFPLNEHTAGFYQVDVSGHGIPAAMFSVLLSKLLTTTPIGNSLLKTAAPTPPGYLITPPHKAIAELNQRLQGNGDMYFTMVYGMLDVKSGRLSFSQAGHPHPIYVRRGDPAVTLGDGGFPVGIMPDMEYDLTELEVRSGDRLFLTSDGITECMNPDGEQFGMQRLTLFIEDHCDDSLKTLLAALQQDLHDWVGGNDFQDDLSMVAMEVL
jgi:sigma-B regulation protein RsbU (phosphoserine phosphatase)